MMPAARHPERPRHSLFGLYFTTETLKFRKTRTFGFVSRPSHRGGPGWRREWGLFPRHGWFSWNLDWLSRLWSEVRPFDHCNFQFCPINFLVIIDHPLELVVMTGVLGFSNGFRGFRKR